MNTQHLNNDTVTTSNGDRPANLPAGTETVRIRKYPNRRLYDTSRSCHLTHEGVLALIADGRSVQVTDSRSGTDITNVVLLQILIERDIAKLQAIPSALIHAAMRTEPATLRTLGEQALASWRPSFGGKDATPPHPATNPATSPATIVETTMRTGDVGRSRLGSSADATPMSSGRTWPARIDELTDSGRPKARPKHLEGPVPRAM